MRRYQQLAYIVKNGFPPGGDYAHTTKPAGIWNYIMMKKKVKNKAAVSLGKKGGDATKATNTDYSALGKKGMANRWKNHKKK
jgi:hypothetical protein